MRKITLFMALVTLLTPLALAKDELECKQKEANLQKQLSYAEYYGNVYRAEGLKRALYNVRNYCGQSNYKDDEQLVLDNEIYAKKLNKKIAKQKEKVVDAQYELEKAKLSGKPKKIREKTEKVEERQKKLDAYQQELDSLK